MPESLNPDLEKQLKDFESAIEKAPEGTPEHEQKIVRDIVREKIDTVVPPPAPAPTSDAAADNPQVMAKVQEVVNLTFNQGLGAAVKKLKEINNPAVTDEYHKVISGRFYQLLLERRKLETL